MNSSGGPLPAAAGYLVAMILMVPIALHYCELCTMLPVSGGGMAYAFRAFGDRIAFISGWAAFGAFITIIPWEASVQGSSLTSATCSRFMRTQG